MKVFTHATIILMQFSQKTEEFVNLKMYKFQSKDFRCQTRDYLLNNIYKFALWMNALQMWNDCTKDKLTSILKAKFKAVLV